MLAKIVLLDKRLKAVASVCGKSSVVADIGSDHGKLALFLLENLQAEKVFVCDISAKSLIKAKKLFSSSKCLDKTEFVVSDGFAQIPCTSLDIAIIAGMGGKEISKIVSEIPKAMNVEKIVCQPMKNVIKFKNDMIEMGYCVCDDVVSKEDDRYYHIVSFKHGKNELSDLELTYGKDNIEKKPGDFVCFLKSEIKRYQKMLNDKTLGKAQMEIEKIQGILRS